MRFRGINDLPCKEMEISDVANDLPKIMQSVTGKQQNWDLYPPAFTAIVLNYIKVQNLTMVFQDHSPMSIKDLDMHVDAYTRLLSLEGWTRWFSLDVCLACD